MKTEHLDELRPYQLKEKLLQLGVELTQEQYKKIVYCGRTFLYAPRYKKKDKTNILYRMTILPYIVWSVFVGIIIQPIKWLFTGSFYFNLNNRIYKFTVEWESRIGL